MTPPSPSPSSGDPPGTTVPRVPPALPPVLFLPVVTYLVVRAATDPTLHPVSVVGLCCGGLFTWTLAEYLMHRFILHYAPSSRFGRRLLYLSHGYHHDYPGDLDHVVASPLASVPLAALFYLAFAAALGASRAVPFFAGFALGYVCYDGLHCVIHHRSLSRFRIVRSLKRRHYRHHYRDESVDFGVTSPLWDFIFRTLPQTR